MLLYRTSRVLRTAQTLIQSNETRQRSGSAEIKGDTTNSAGRHQMRVLALTFSMTMRTEELTRGTVLENKWKVLAERSRHMFLWCRIKSVYRKGLAHHSAVRGIQNRCGLRETTRRLHSSLEVGTTNKYGKHIQHASSSGTAEYMFQAVRRHVEKSMAATGTGFVVRSWNNYEEQQIIVFWADVFQQRQAEYNSELDFFDSSFCKSTCCSQWLASGVGSKQESLQSSIHVFLYRNKMLLSLRMMQ